MSHLSPSAKQIQNAYGDLRTASALRGSLVWRAWRKSAAMEQSAPIISQQLTLTPALVLTATPASPQATSLQAAQVIEACIGAWGPCQEMLVEQQIQHMMSI